MAWLITEIAWLITEIAWLITELAQKLLGLAYYGNCLAYRARLFFIKKRQRLYYLPRAAINMPREKKYNYWRFKFSISRY